MCQCVLAFTTIYIPKSAAGLIEIKIKKRMCFWWRAQTLQDSTEAASLMSYLPTVLMWTSTLKKQAKRVASIYSLFSDAALLWASLDAHIRYIDYPVIIRCPYNNSIFFYSADWIVNSPAGNLLNRESPIAFWCLLINLLNIVRVCFRVSAALHRHVQKWSLDSDVGDCFPWSFVPALNLRWWLSNATLRFGFFFVSSLDLSDNKVGGCIMFVFVTMCSSVCACPRVYIGILCYWVCSLVSCATISPAHTWLHSSMFRHSDESHAPFLHFCSHSVFLWDTDSSLSVSHAFTRRATSHPL